MLAAVATRMSDKQQVQPISAPGRRTTKRKGEVSRWETKERKKGGGGGGGVLEARVGEMTRRQEAPRRRNAITAAATGTWWRSGRA